MEKRAFPIAGALNAALNISSLKSTIQENKKKVQLEPIKDQADKLQLPGSNAYDFEGGKRIGSSSVTAMNKF